MKKLLLILLCVPLIGFGQQTYVPDDNFEQALINMGYDNVLDNYVQTSNINMVTNLNVNSQLDRKMLLDIMDRLNAIEKQLNSSNSTKNNVHDVILFIIIGIFVLFALDSIFRLGRLTV